MSLTENRFDELHEEMRHVKYIDARLSVWSLFVAAVAVISSYVWLQADVARLKETIIELKQDRATWIAQTDRIAAELRAMSSLDAVQSTRISNLEDAVRVLQRRTNGAEQHHETRP